MPYKYTALFELNTLPNAFSPIQRLGGWSESWYSTSSSDMPFFLVLLAARANLLPATARIVGQRLQRVDPVGVSQVFSQPFAGGGLSTDIPQMALYCRCRTDTATNTRPMYIRGIPDTMVAGGEFNPILGYGPILDTYLALLISQRWRFRGRDLTEVAGDLLAVVDVAGQIRLITELPQTWVSGDVLTVSGVVLPDGTKAKAKVRVLTPLDTFTFPVAGWTHDGGLLGKALKVVYTTFPVTAIAKGRAVTKKVGRPFTGYRGRRSNRKVEVGVV